MEAIGKYENAIIDFGKALELRSGNSAAYFQRGNVFHQLKRHLEAIEDYNKALELNPKLIQALLKRGLAYRSSGKIKDLTEFVRL